MKRTGTLNAKTLAMDGVVLVTPTRFEDSRGYFEETFNRDSFADAVGDDVEFVQDNESLSRAPGTIRGLHYQLPPSAQGKLVRVTAGRALDVAVDLRTSSPTFGHHLSVELDHLGGEQLWIPPGLAHGFCTLEPDTIVSYKVTAFYDPEAERSLAWSDPELAIAWPVGPGPVVLSAKDAAALSLSAAKEQGCVF